MGRHHDEADDDLAAMSDSLKWTAVDLAEARPFHEVLPGLAESEADVVHGAIDRDFVERFEAASPGWEARLNCKHRAAVETA